jgi:hypothetical protein
MPPKKRAKTKPKPTQKQKQKQAQRQSVTVNVGSSKSKPRKSSGRGGLPPPSHMHNLAPTFVTNQQIDYTPLISSILHASNKIGAPNSISQRTIENPVTPLSSTQSSTSQSSSAEEMAGEAALRRAGPTAGNLQPHPSQADERISMSMEDKPPPVRDPDPIITERLVKKDIGSGGGGIPEVASGGGGFPEAESFVKKGRPFAQATRAVPLNQSYLIARRPAAEEPSTEPKPEAGKKAETKADKQKKKKKINIVEPPG